MLLTCIIYQNYHSTTPWPLAHRSVSLVDKLAVTFDRRHTTGPQKKTLIGILVKNLAQSGEQETKKCLYRFHAISSAKRVGTKGASWVTGCFRPEITLIHCKADSSTMTATSTTNSPVTAKSRRSLKSLRPRSAVAGPDMSCRAWARKPMRGLGSNILCHEA